MASDLEGLGRRIAMPLFTLYSSLFTHRCAASPRARKIAFLALAAWAAVAFADDPGYTVSIKSDQVHACPGDPLFFAAVPSVTLSNPTYRWFVKTGEDGEFMLSDVYGGNTFGIEEMADTNLYLYVECEDKPKPGGAPARPGKVTSEVFKVQMLEPCDVNLCHRTTTGECYGGTDFNFAFGASSVDWNQNPPAGLEEYFSEQGIHFRAREGSIENQTELGVSLYIDDSLMVNPNNKFYVQRPSGNHGVNADLFDLRFDADKFSGKNYCFAMRFYLIFPPGGCTVEAGAKVIARTGHGTQTEDHIIVKLYYDETNTLLTTYKADKGTGVAWYEFANDLNSHYNRPGIKSEGAIYRFEVEYFGYMPPVPGLSAYIFQPYFENFPKCATVAIDYVSAQAESVCVTQRSACVGDYITAVAAGFHADEAQFAWKKYADQTYAQEVALEGDEIICHTNAHGAASQVEIKMKSTGVFYYSVQNTNPGSTGIAEPFKFSLIGRDRDGWLYKENKDGTATVTGANRAEGNLTMPGTLGGLTVTAVGSGAFTNCTVLTGMAIPDSVTDIGTEAFRLCTSLTNVWLGTGIERVGADAFKDCTNLATLWVPVEQEGTGLLDAAGLPNSCAIHWYGKDFTANDIALTPYNGEYDGQPHAIGVETNAIPGLVLKFCGVATSEAQSLTTNHLPLTTINPRFINVTNVTVYVEASAPGYFTTTNSATVTITPRPATFTGKSETKKYTGSEIEISTVVVSNLVAGHAHNVTFSAKGTDVGEYAGAITDADAVYISDGGTDVTANYDVTVENGALTIEQDANLAFEVSLAGASFTYDGQPHALADPATNNVASGTTTVEYSKNQSNWTANLSSLTATHVADSCTIHVRATNPNYANPATNSAALTVTEAANAWIAAPSMAGWTAGSTPATPNRGRAKFGTATVAYGKAGGAAGGLGATRPSAAGSYVATFTVAGTANYSGLVKNVPFTIAAAPPPTPPSPAPPSPTTYKVKFKANGGKLPKGKKMAAQTFTTGKAKKLRKNAFKRSGYVFVGWAMRKNGPVAYRNGQKVKNLSKAGKTVTLYAVWAKETYKVFFDASGGRGKMPVQKFVYGDARHLARNQFTRDGYAFGGWAIRDSLATVKKVAYKDGQKVKNLSTAGGPVTLYAVWKRR